MTQYHPETPFQIESNLVFNLRTRTQGSFRDQLENDISIKIETRSFKDDDLKAEISQVIAKALNAHFPVTSNT
jgi:hypothetical protein